MTTQPLSTEAAALHAVIEDDEDEARRILSTFLPGELLRLYGDAQRLAGLAHDVRTNQCGSRGPRVGAEGTPTCTGRTSRGARVTW